MRRAQTLSRNIELIFRFFRFFGFPDSIEKKKSYLLTKCRIFIILSVLLYAINSTVFIELYRVYRDNGYPIHVVTHLANSLAAIVPIIASYIHRDKMVQLQMKFKLIEELLRQINVRVDHKLLIRSSLMHIVCYLLIYTSTIGYAATQAYLVNPNRLRLVVYYYLAFIIGLMATHRYRFFIQQVTAHACIINRLLCRLQCHSKNSSQTLQKIEVLKKAHRLLIDATMSINVIFSFQIAVVLGEMYLCVFHRTYLACNSISHGKTNTLQFLAISMALYAIVSTNYDAEICGRMVRCEMTVNVELVIRVFI